MTIKEILAVLESFFAAATKILKSLGIIKDEKDENNENGTEETTGA